MNTPTSQELLIRLQTRDDAAAAELFDRYAQRLVALARQRISPALARRLDPDDVVQSAYRSFFLKARQGEFVWRKSGDLWSLLVQITLHKLHRQVARHKAQKRSIEREEGALDRESHGPRASLDPEPQPVEVIALLEQMSLIMHDLTDDQRQALQLRLQGDSEVEIGRTLACSPRTVRRHLQQAREILEQQLLADAVTPAITRQGKPSPPPAFDPRAPLPYEDFLIEDHLGSGGMGKVYRALQRSLDRPVAIKALMKSRLSDRQAVERFLQEGKLLGRLRHKNIVGIHGIGRFPGGGYFLALDLVEGVTLAERLAGGSLAAQEACKIILEVATAIAYAHEKGVLHGDLTPGNVLLDETGHVYVTDFGFGQLLQHDDPSHSAGGTLGFLAPEQLSENATLDQRTDVYGLGAVWYAMLTGRPPIDPQLDVAAAARAIVRPPSSVNHSIPEVVDRVCLWALARRLEDRPADAASFAKAVQECLSSGRLGYNPA